MIYNLNAVTIESKTETPSVSHTVKFSPTSAGLKFTGTTSGKAGDSITLTSSAYTISKIVDSNGNTVSFTTKAGLKNTYRFTFTMPNSNVTVYATASGSGGTIM